MEGCNYLLAVDVEMNTVSGYEMSSWEQGYGDFVITPDLGTLRLAPWLPGSAMVQCDLSWLDGTPVAPVAPAGAAARRSTRRSGSGSPPSAAPSWSSSSSATPSSEASDANYQGLTGSTRYNVDYSILGTSADEPLMRDIRNAMYGAGLTVESSKGECNFGQHEIAFRYDEVLRTADNHVVFKAAAKELAAQHGKALTFMAKYDEREGNSCHMHMSLRGTDGAIVFADSSDSDGTATAARSSPSFVAGVLATLREFTLLYAPTVNSYKRYQPGSFAPRPSRGARTTGPARCGSSGTAPACGWRTGCRAVTSTPTWRRPRCSPAGCTGSATSWSWSRRSSATPTTPDSARGAEHPARRPRPVRRRPSWPRPRSARTWSAHYAAGRGRRARGVRRHRDRLGAPAGVRAVLIGPDLTMLHAVVDPATEEVVTEVESLDAAQVDAAVARAVAAGPAWRAVAPADRARLLRRFAAVVDAHVDELAELEVRGAGHTIGNARWEAGNVRDVLDYYAAAPERLFGRQIPVAGGLDVTFREPLGVVGIIVPWNFPMPIAGWGFAPALAAGNTVVLKPAELTPLTALRLAELALRGRAARRTCSRCCPARARWSGERLVTHEQVRKIVFTGSTEVGHARSCAGRADQVEAGHAGARRQVARTSSSPTRTWSGRRRARPSGVFDNAGQDCCARSRILVQRPVVRPVPGAAGAGRHRAAGRVAGASRTPRWAR